MQTLSFQQNNRAPSEHLKFQYQHSEAEGQPVDHRAICSAVRAWAAAEGRVAVALAIKEAAEQAELDSIDMTGSADVWNVKLFRWLDNHEKSPAYRANVEQLAPVIISVLPLAYRDRVIKHDCFAVRVARSVKEDAEAIQAVVLKAPRHERMKEISESIVAKLYLDGPDSVAPIMAMVTTMLGGALWRAQKWRKPRCSNTNGFQVQKLCVIAENSMSNTAEIINFPNKTEQPGGRMADLSNGYTKVANEIQQLKPRLRLSGREWQCFEAVIWLTYGWNKKQDRVTNTVIAELTGLSDTHVSDALKSLAERKIIFSQKQGMMKIVGVNTDLSAWILDKPETGRKFPKTGKSFPKSGITFPKTVDTQYKNKNSIKRSSSENSDESSDARLKKFLSTHPEAAVYTPSGAKWGSAEDLETAKWISSRVKLINPTCKAPDMTSWSNTVRLMRQIDNRSHQDICALYDWASKHHFWQTNILSPESLRKQWDKLTMQRNAGGEQRAVKPDLDFNNTDWAYGVIR